MNTNIATAQDQSQRLLHCGVSADPVGFFAHWQYEVIGNIHDNPTLISDKK